MISQRIRKKDLLPKFFGSVIARKDGRNTRNMKTQKSQSAFRNHSGGSTVAAETVPNLATALLPEAKQQFEGTTSVASRAATRQRH